MAYAWGDGAWGAAGWGGVTAFADSVSESAATSTSEDPAATFAVSRAESISTAPFFNSCALACLPPKNHIIGADKNPTKPNQLSTKKFILLTYICY
jgi:hypothetical protein